MKVKSVSKKCMLTNKITEWIEWFQWNVCTKGLQKKEEEKNDYVN